MRKTPLRPVALRLLSIMALALIPFAAAQAYVGPGAGLSLLGALWGVLAAIGAAFLFIIMWPIRRLLRRKRQLGEANTAAHAPHDDSGSARPDDERAGKR